MVRQEALKRIEIGATVEVFGSEGPSGCHHRRALVVGPLCGGGTHNHRGVLRKGVGIVGRREYSHGKVVGLRWRKRDDDAVGSLLKGGARSAVEGIDVGTICYHHATVDRAVSHTATKVDHEVEVGSLHPCERRALRHGHVHHLVAIGKLHAQAPIAPVVGNGIGWVKLASFHRDARVVLHLASVGAPVARVSHIDAVALGAHHLRIGPQDAAVGVHQQIRPPVVGRNRFAHLAVSHIDVAGFHISALVAAVGIGLRLAQRRVLGITAAPHSNKLLRRRRERQSGEP